MCGCWVMGFVGTAVIPSISSEVILNFVVVVVVCCATGLSSSEGLSEHIEADGDHEQGAGPLQNQ